MKFLPSALVGLAILVQASCAPPRGNQTVSPQYGRRYFTSPIEPAPSQAPALTTQRVILIETDPPGARIEVNDEYEGTSPLSVSVPANPDGTWKLYTQITALPVNPGQQVQTKLFFTFDNHQIPNRIFFDMNLVSPRPSIDVNLNPDE